MTRLVVPSRFNGPAHSGNGGWVSGSLATLLTPLPASAPDDAVRVVLRTPPPLEVELDVRPDDEGLGAWDGETLVAHAAEVTSPFTGPPPEPVTWAQAQSTAAAYGGLVGHPFPTCFTCGPQRGVGDGLRLTPGMLAGRAGTSACTWTPDPSLVGGSAAGSPGAGSEVPTAVCWAAMDCPGGWSVDLAGRPMVLGTMTAQVHELPRIGARHVVVGHALGEDGRKAFTETALYAIADDDRSVRLLARATAVWIRVDPAAVRPA